MIYYEAKKNVGILSEGRVVEPEISSVYDEKHLVAVAVCRNKWVLAWRIYVSPKKRSSYRRMSICGHLSGDGDRRSVGRWG